jgi:Carboxypeptidase regulatory-like domain
MKTKIILLLAVMMFSVFALHAQTVTGTIKGNIADTAGAVVPGVAVEILNTETGFVRNVVTDNDGNYQATFLPIGMYKVSIDKSGFGKVVRENIEIRLNDTTNVSFRLDPKISESVTVTDEPAPINTTNSEVKGTLTEVQIEAKPTLNQGNFLTLAETFTGYQENPTSGQNNPTASSGSSVNFNGTGTRGATFQINGVNNDDSSENQNRQGASLATIKEFQVLTNNFSAEFGRGFGAVVLVQTKQGTNKFKGEAYWFHNDSYLNAKRHFSTSTPKPVNRRNQYGAVLGMPIFKNKLFGFFSFDQKRESGALNFRRDIFTAAERNPANWFLKAPTNNTPANRAFIQSVINRFPNVTPNDPVGLLRTYAAQVGFNRPLDDYSARLDWNLGDRDNITTRYQYTRQIFDNEDIIIGEATRQNNKQQNIGGTWTHIFSPSVSGEFRYGLGLRTTLVGIKAGNNTPIIRFTNSPISGSIIGNAGSFPINRFQTDNQFVYNVSAILGSHYLKFGTDVRRVKLDDVADSFSRGFYTFNSVGNTTTTGCPLLAGQTIEALNPYEALLNGCVINYVKGFGPFFLENRINEYNFYAEDNYKLRTNVTLNIGYRYELVSAPKELKDRIAYGYGADSDNHEPRVGMAWSPNFSDGILGKVFGQSGDSSIRMGYGLFHGRIFQSVFSQTGASIRFNPPNSAQITFTGITNLGDPTNGFVFTPGTPTARVNLTIADPDLQMPYTQQWSASFERKLGWNSALRLTYSGNRGIGLLRFRQANLPSINSNGVFVVNHPFNDPTVLYTAANRPVGDPRAADLRGQVIRLAANAQCAGTGLVGVAITAACPVAVPLAANEYSFRVPRFNERRGDGRYGTNTEVSNGAWSYYHGLQIEYIKRLSNNLSFTANYTLSKAIDTNSEATFVGGGDTNANGPNTKLSRSLSRFNTPHRFTLFMTYKTPFFANRKDFLGQTLGNWNTSIVFKRSYGTPFTVTQSVVSDLDLDGFTDSRPVILDTNLLGRIIANPNSSQNQLPLSGFRAATTADFGSGILGRNTFYGDGVANIDISIYKSFPMPFEGHRIVLRADMFNAFNHVRYGLPNSVWTPPTPTPTPSNFGRITTESNDYAPRNVQFSLRYVF